MISLVLATYNGEKYIIDQLDSIRNQTRQPDEVIIRDDCSTDSTVELINRYIDNYHLNWRLVQGENNLGWRENYYLAIKESSGEYVFLCDQDDIWHRNKIEYAVKSMDSHPEIELLVTGFHPFFEGKVEHLKYKGDIWNNGSLRKFPFDKSFLSVCYPGCTYCFRNSLKEEYLEYRIPEVAHDAMLWCFAIQKERLYCLDTVLMEYRRHDGAATGKNVNLDKNEMRVRCAKMLKTVDLLLILNASSDLSEEKLAMLKKMRKWLELREKLYSGRNLLNAVDIIPYLSCYEKPKHFVRDIILSVK